VQSVGRCIVYDYLLFLHLYAAVRKGFVKIETVPNCQSVGNDYKTGNEEVDSNDLQCKVVARFEHKDVEYEIEESSYCVHHHKPGGVLQIGVPDYSCIAFKYVKEYCIEYQHYAHHKL
jgi:hypothetical protein